MAAEKQYIFGPVPSRRLGLSLGVDIVPFKVCTLDCVYCQLGRTTQKTVERKAYVEVAPVINELKNKLAQGIKADYVTISGSGEPTLNSLIGEFVKAIKKLTDIPLAIITNGTLFHLADVRKDCAGADVVVPSLDAGNQEAFARVNRPAEGITIENLINGLSLFRDEYAGRIWLEVFLVEGFNTDAEQIRLLKSAIERIRPDKVQLNTAVRPTAEAQIHKIGAERLNQFAAEIGAGAEVVADFTLHPHAKEAEIRAENILSMLKRRPCSLQDICSGLGIARHEALKYLGYLDKIGVLGQTDKGGVTFFVAK